MEEKKGLEHATVEVQKLMFHSILIEYYLLNIITSAVFYTPILDVYNN